MSHCVINKGCNRFVTIAVAMQVHDGIVLASDSASTMIENAPPGGSARVINVYNNANKIFNLRKGLPIGGLTFSAGSIGPYSISTLSKDLRKRFSGDDPNYSAWHLDKKSYRLEDVAEQTREFLYEEHWKAASIPPSPGVQLGFVVAGFSAGAPLSEAWLIEIKDGVCAAPQRLFSPGETRIYAGGEPEVFNRLVLGHGSGLEQALVKGGVPQGNAPHVVTALEAEMREELFEAAMPIQDAIDFSEFLVHTTAMFSRFKRGAATVGGPIESCAITKHEGFTWVRRKHYFDALLNPKEIVSP